MLSDTELLELANQGRKTAGLVDLSKVRFREEIEEDFYPVHVSDDLALLACMYGAGSALYAWDYVYLVKLNDEQRQKYYGKYALISTTLNYRVTDKLHNFKQDFLAGYKVAKFLSSRS